MMAQVESGPKVYPVLQMHDREKLWTLEEFLKMLESSISNR
jgi:hypothetical protein